MATYSGQGNALVQQTERQAEVFGSHNVLAQTCEELCMVMNDLELRLHPVLAQRLEDSNKDQSQPEALRVPVAQLFHDRSTQVYGVVKQIRSILERLEV